MFHVQRAAGVRVIDLRAATVHGLADKMRSTLPCVAVCALLWAISAFPAVSQEALGKTIQAKYSLHSCTTTNGICSPVQTYHGNVYVSRQGHVYDYTGVEKGKVYTLGVTEHDKGADTTFTAEGSTLSIKSDISGGSFTTIYRIKGNTCEVSGHGTFRNVRNRFSTLECSVIDGNPN
jgi:hypothetical protein